MEPCSACILGNRRQLVGCWLELLVFGFMISLFVPPGPDVIVSLEFVDVTDRVRSLVVCLPQWPLCFVLGGDGDEKSSSGTTNRWSSTLLHKSRSLLFVVLLELFCVANSSLLICKLTSSSSTIWGKSDCWFVDTDWQSRWTTDGGTKITDSFSSCSCRKSPKSTDFPDSWAVAFTWVGAAGRAVVNGVALTPSKTLTNWGGRFGSVTVVGVLGWLVAGALEPPRQGKQHRNTVLSLSGRFMGPYALSLSRWNSGSPPLQCTGRCHRKWRNSRVKLTCSANIAFSPTRVAVKVRLCWSDWSWDSWQQVGRRQHYKHINIATRPHLLDGFNGISISRMVADPIKCFNNKRENRRHQRSETDDERHGQKINRINIIKYNFISNIGGWRITRSVVLVKIGGRWITKMVSILELEDPHWFVLS